MYLVKCGSRFENSKDIKRIFVSLGCHMAVCATLMSLGESVAFDIELLINPLRMAISLSHLHALV